MNFMVGYFSHRKVFHIVEWFETYDEAKDWVLEHGNIRKDFVIFLNAAQLERAALASPPCSVCGSEMKPLYPDCPVCGTPSLNPV
jgi:hypothetical protein